MTFHVRRPLKRARGNSFYRDTSDRYNGTFCGAEPTSYDVPWRAKAAPFLGRLPCAACLAARAAEKVRS